MSLYIIYGLRARHTSEIRYVGLTTIGGETRLRRHGYKTYTEKSKYPVHNWIRSIGLEKVELVVLEECPQGDYEYLLYAERYWELELRDLGHRLKNATECGKRNPRMKGAAHPLYGVGHSEASRAKISANHADVTGAKNPNFGKGLKGVDNPSYGKPFSEVRKANVYRGQLESVKNHTAHHERREIIHPDCPWCSYSILYDVKMSEYA